MVYITASSSKHTSLDHATTSSMSLCGANGVLPDAIGTIHVYTMPCVPHLTARYMYVYQILTSQLHILELEINVHISGRLFVNRCKIEIQIF